MLQLFVFILILICSIEATYRNCASCTSTNIWCANGEDCTINCYACANSRIYCPQTAHTCNVLCFTNTGIRSCENVYIDAVSNTTSLTVNATGHNDIFIGGTIMCPRNNANCKVSCGSDYACRNLIINATHSLHTNVSLTATGLGAFERGRLLGSTFGTINVNCFGDNSCKQSTIKSHPDSLQLDINANGQFVMQLANIYCPNNGPNKNIICNIHLSGTQGMQSSKIYAAEAFYDINFMCDPSYHEGCSAITLLCDDYVYSCPIVLNGATASNSWQCSSQAAYCDSFSYPPTPQPTITSTTLTPTFMPSTTNPTLFPTSIPTKNPTLFPSTSIPTINPTLFPTTSIPTFLPSVNTGDLYGVEVTIRLEYDLSDDTINVTESSLQDIITNITDELLQTDTNDVDDNCIKTKDYNIDIDTTQHIVVINATIYVCDKQTETILIVYYEDMNLESDLVEIIRENQVLIVTAPDIQIEVDVIKHKQIVSTIIKVETSEGLHIVVYSNDNGLFGIIMAVFGSVVLFCIIIIIVICVHNARKDKSLPQPGQSVVNFGKSKSNSKSRERVRSISHERIETNTNTNSPGETNKTDENIIEPGTAGKRKDSESVNVIYENDESNAEIIIDGNESDETPGNIKHINVKHENSEQRRPTLDGSVDEKEDSNDQILVKKWLENIDMVFCYDSLTANGYDSLEIIKEIKEKELLIEIGINEIEIVDKLMIKIEELRQNDKVEKEKTNGFVDENTIGNTQGFVDDDTIK